MGITLPVTFPVTSQAAYQTEFPVTFPVTFPITFEVVTQFLPADSALFQQRVRNRSVPDRTPAVVEAPEVPAVKPQNEAEVQSDVPLVRSKTFSHVQSTPIAPGNLTLRR